MNNDLISREDLSNAIDTIKQTGYDSDGEPLFDYVELDDLIKVIYNAPPCEPEKVLVANVTFDADKLKEIVQTEVIEKIKSGDLVIRSEKSPQGKWEKQNFFYKCSVCGAYSPDGTDLHNYCPDCGAKMEVKNEGNFI